MKNKYDFVISTPGLMIHDDKGHVTCTPGCGFNCSTEAYAAARQACESALKGMADRGFNLNNAWVGELWDNCGWHWRLCRGDGWEIWLMRDGLYEIRSGANARLPFVISSRGHTTPEAAILAATTDILRASKAMQKECATLIGDLQ